jgi:hypothetical protein
MIRRQQQHVIPEPNSEGNHEAPVAQVPNQPNEDEFAPAEVGNADDDAQSLPEGVPTNEEEDELEEEEYDGTAHQPEQPPQAPKIVT